MTKKPTNAPTKSGDYVVRVDSALPRTTMVIPPPPPPKPPKGS